MWFWIFFFILAVFMCKNLLCFWHRKCIIVIRPQTLFDNKKLSDAFPSDRLDCIAQFSKRYKKVTILWDAIQSTENIWYCWFMKKKKHICYLKWIKYNPFSSICLLKMCFFKTNKCWLVYNRIYFNAGCEQAHFIAKDYFATK